MNTKSSIYDVHYAHLYAGHLSETAATELSVKGKHDFRPKVQDTLNYTKCLTKVFKETHWTFMVWLTTGVKLARAQTANERAYAIYLTNCLISLSFLTVHRLHFRGYLLQNCNLLRNQTPWHWVQSHTVRPLGINSLITFHCTNYFLNSKPTNTYLRCLQSLQGPKQKLTLFSLAFLLLLTKRDPLALL